VRERTLAEEATARTRQEEAARARQEATARARQEATARTRQEKALLALTRLHEQSSCGFAGAASTPDSSPRWK
jgi:hypothetical protein